KRKQRYPLGFHKFQHQTELNPYFYSTTVSVLTTYMRQLIPLCILIYLLISCTAKKQNDATKIEEPAISGLSGEELAVAHCSRCHSFVDPELLTKTIWKEDVLPAMGHRMGIYGS